MHGSRARGLGEQKRGCRLGAAQNVDVRNDLINSDGHITQVADIVECKTLCKTLIQIVVVSFGEGKNYVRRNPGFCEWA